MISLTQTFVDAFSLDPSEVEELQFPSIVVVYLSAFVNASLALVVSVALRRRRQRRPSCIVLGEIVGLLEAESRVRDAGQSCHWVVKGC